MSNVIGADEVDTLDPRFEIVTTFNVTVPENYNHARQLTSFAKKHRGGFYFYSDNVTDANFTMTTQRLMPGKTYGVKIWGIKRGRVISSPDCVAFYKAQRAILVSVQGLSLAWEQKKEEFPKGKCTVSFDKRDALSYLRGYHGMPSVFAGSVGVFLLVMCSFESVWGAGYCLLCFCDEE